MRDLEQFTTDKIKHLTMAIDQSAFTAIRERLIEEKAMAEIALKAMQAKPEYFIVRRLFTDAYGTHVELDVYLEQIDASKHRDDHGGVIVPCYATPPLNSPVIPDGWKLVPVNPTDKMLLNAMIAGEIDSILPAISRAESMWEQFLSASPNPE